MSEIHSTDSTQPKLVTPAEALTVPPAAALDPLVGEPTILDKAIASAKPYLDHVEKVTHPYVEKVQATTKPYTDAAAAKAKELVDRIEGTPSGPPATLSNSLVRDEKTLDPSAPVPATSATSTTGDLGNKAKGIFGQGLSTLQSTFNQITHTIEEKTATPTHPGIITQATAAFNKGVDKVGAFVDGTPAPAGTTAPVAVGGTPAVVPVTTTTNTVPHPVIPHA